MMNGIYFPSTTFAQNINIERNKPSITYYPSSSGAINFKGIPENTEMYIYDMSGRLIRNVQGSYWDGLNKSGSQVRNGYYVTNIKMPEGVVNMKILKK